MASLVAHWQSMPAGAGGGVSVTEMRRPLEKERAAHSSILVWEIPWTEKPDGVHGVAEEWNRTEHLNNNTRHE